MARGRAASAASASARRSASCATCPSLVCCVALRLWPSSPSRPPAETPSPPARRSDAELHDVLPRRAPRLPPAVVLVRRGLPERLRLQVRLASSPCFPSQLAPLALTRPSRPPSHARPPPQLRHPRWLVRPVPRPAQPLHRVCRPARGAGGVWRGGAEQAGAGQHAVLGGAGGRRGCGRRRGEGRRQGDAGQAAPDGVCVVWLSGGAATSSPRPLSARGDKSVGKHCLPLHAPRRSSRLVSSRPRV